MSKNTANDSTATGANPFGDFGKMFEQFKVPGVDMSAIADARRKDIEALVDANKAVYEGMQALANKQAEILKQAMEGIQGAAGSTGVGDPAKQAELARKAFEKTLSDMKDLAEIARKSQADALASITQRATQNMQEVQKMMRPK
ncbi:TIGR01841 family phasin [Pollutimonas bauzanensis]|jgi:phasin family protein|uniref:phasin family protein n=1 Tax=Pollutimonas bauzanensis TaxID=658167 RepID=UPI00333E6E42